MKAIGHEPRLRWALVDDVPRSISDFASLPPRMRPAARCPACMRPVTFKLGSEIAHHVAHRPGEDCVAARGETALHLNTKFHLARELQKGSALHVAVLCSEQVFEADTYVESPCDALGAVPWAVPPWDEAAVERLLGARRPDIVLSQGGAPIAAVEVFATHAVDADKASDFAALGVPWLEVRASESLYAGPGAWTLAAPLSVHRSSHSIEWRCAEHDETAEGHAETAEDREVLPRTTLESSTRHERLWGRIIDIYETSGFRRRGVSEMIATYTDGRIVDAWLEGCAGGPRASITRLGTEHDVASELAAAYRREVARLGRAGVLIDSPMSWKSASVFPWHALNASRTIARFPTRYEWDRAEQRWVLADACRDLRWLLTDDDRGAKR